MGFPRIALVAAEPSGDQLGAVLMHSLRQRYPEVEFEGVGGERMAVEGLASRIPMETLGVMGLAEVVRHLPALLRERRQLRDHWAACPPDLFIGVDAPDFNLGLARALRAMGIPTVQYVAPTVWAWRAGRVRTLRRSVDLVLSIFPFEEAFLRRQGVEAVYIGHPLADQFPLEVDVAAARRALSLPLDARVVALLPGSRRSEVAALTRPFLKTALHCLTQDPELSFVVPLVDGHVAQIFETIRREVAPELPLTRVKGRSREVLAAADVVLTASGTATLECLLSKKPMVVGYRVHGLTWFLARHLRLVKLPWIAMANILAGEALAPELLQGRCTAEYLAPAVMAWLEDSGRAEGVRRRYGEIHEQLLSASGEAAVDALAKLITEAAT